jgi:hypothetical protein
VTEILTPIIRIVPGERIIVRLTNHSRDGVADQLVVGGDSVSAPAFAHFRLNQKEGVVTDTLSMAWKEPVTEGTYLVPVRIGHSLVARAAARKFSAIADTSKRIGLVTGLGDSPTAEALRRLGCLHTCIVDPDSGLSSSLEGIDVLILDRRVLSLRPQVRQQTRTLAAFVSRGGHLVILAQDPDPWNAATLWEGVHLAPASALAIDALVSMDSTHALLSTPNRVEAPDLSDWMFRKGYNEVTLPQNSGAKAVVRLKEEGWPLMVTDTSGKGKITYVDLALQPQWMNLHPGSFKILGNLISF